MKSRLNDSECRDSADKWLEAAYQNLLEGGVESVRIAFLSKRLNLARTSFYRFFEGREALLSVLLNRWKSKNTGNFVRQTKRSADSIAEAILNVFDCCLNPDIFDLGFERAVRGWAQKSKDVSAEIKAADIARINALKSMFLRFGYSETAGDVRACTVYHFQMGYILMQNELNPDANVIRVADYVEIFSGQQPTRQQLNHFLARHGYQP